jgi:hypothetical protein
MRLQLIPTNSGIKTICIQVAIVTLIWVIFYRLSLWLFSYFEYNPSVYWIFLPAGIRMISVFIFGWAGVLGLFIGSVITNEEEMSNYVIYLAMISSLAPMFAKRICKWLFNISSTLQGLTGKQLLVFSVVGALANALFSSLHFYVSSVSESFNDFAPMFVGDLLGTFIILYLVKGLLRLAIALYNPRADLHEKNSLLDCAS